MDPISIKPETLMITALSEEGEGIGRLDGMAVFVPGVLPGETVECLLVEQKKNYARGRLTRVLTASPSRVSPPCPYFPECGGCQLQHLDYPGQLEAKRVTVQDALERIGGFKGVDVPLTLGMAEPFRYRNNGQYHIRRVNGRVRIGFFKAGTHEVIDIADCLIQPEINSRVVAVVRDWAESTGVSTYNPKTQEGILRHLMIRHSNVTGGLMVVLVATSKTLQGSDALVERLRGEVSGIESIVLNTNTKPGGQVLGPQNKVLYGNERILGELDGFHFGISPLSFFQVNTEQTRVLYQKAVEFAGLSGGETVFDVYSGIGTISLSLSRQAQKVYGIESVRPAVEDAVENAKRAGLDHVEFIAGRAEDVMPRLAEQGVRPDVVVLDPPRKGCEPEVLRTLLDMKPEKIVYVSCKPSTLARDLKVLCGGGESGLEAAAYELVAVQPVDLFGGTGHVETCVLLSLVVSPKSSGSL
ncbi:23S rRNA (uracil(1939)-C(5))-methyltransferase RlmD [Acidaminobacter hydrogenoformans]|uniref:23S rRNA m(5)U-1939 methyltransferase n=1 Tax=Acidaminobacter hydrogenoformans DSM 2784 TaxID=1120920 RepID=A0A1G5S2U6_9FIRM|nr:23S rRNA (uracil(1939)-C(5))-methyltransferase RlmD [Acidaminobacter hydrogenoformans]SCZ79889.1 23S rRNA m(5)U-1939 methyltransferase [Acidaminobacter hydrogenoformans DSM 2784]